MPVNIPWIYLILIALVLGLSPIGQTPHLVEKLQMLFRGTLSRPIDIFDLILHSSPLVLIGLKAWHEFG